VVVRPLAASGTREAFAGGAGGGELVRSLKVAASVAFFALMPIGALAVTLWAARNSIAYDLHHAFRPAAEALLDGRSPYPPPTPEAVGTRTAWVYLPFASFLFVPFALVPPLAADLAATALVLAAGATALWILGVRDWRCYGIAVFSMPVFSAIQTANLTLPLALALAAIWVLRARPGAPGVVLATTLATKLFLWPVLVWLLATRRYTAAAYSVVVTTALVLGGWAVLGFESFRDYPEILRLLSAALETDSYTPFALAHDLHAPEPVARAIGLGLGGAVLLACWILGRRGDDTRSFTLAVFAALLFTPIVWLHYFALLLVPVAVTHRHLSPLWAVPIAVWFFGEGYGNGTTAQTALMLVTAGVMIAATLRSSPRHARRALAEPAT
jgi:alpha-1,2-mannosyltransferase